MTFAFVNILTPGESIRRSIHHPGAVAPGTMEREGKGYRVCHTSRSSETITAYADFAGVLRRIDPVFPRHGKAG